MRSDVVFTAAAKINNRFMLCRIVCAASRACHRDGVPIQETVNWALLHVETPPPSFPIIATLVPAAEPEHEPAAA